MDLRDSSLEGSPSHSRKINIQAFPWVGIIFQWFPVPSFRTSAFSGRRILTMFNIKGVKWYDRSGFNGSSANKSKDEGKIKLLRKIKKLETSF